MDKRTGLLLGRLEFLRSREKELVGHKLDRPEDWDRVTAADLETWLGRPVRAHWDERELRRRCEGDLRYLERAGVGWILRGESGFPAALAEIPDPPWALWTRGGSLALDRSWVAIVGTRLPSEEAKRAARDLGRGLAEARAVVVSGLARGIDGQAHRGALETGTTVAVFGCGIDQISPSGHLGLARQIVAAGGTLVSEYGPGEPAFGYRFVARNRIISGLSRSVVVVQAPLRSGALLTADFALDQGRDVAVHARGLQGERGAGTRVLAEQGAPVVVGADDVMAMWKNGSPQGPFRQGELEWGDR